MTTTTMKSVSVKESNERGEVPNGALIAAEIDRLAAPQEETNDR